MNPVLFYFRLWYIFTRFTFNWRYLHRICIFRFNRRFSDTVLTSPNSTRTKFPKFASRGQERTRGEFFSPRNSRTNGFEGRRSTLGRSSSSAKMNWPKRDFFTCARGIWFNAFFAKESSGIGSAGIVHLQSTKSTFQVVPLCKECSHRMFLTWRRRKETKRAWMACWMTFCNRRWKGACHLCRQIDCTAQVNQSLH